MAEMISTKKAKADARIRQQDRVADEDFFRTVKENRIMNKL